MLRAESPASLLTTGSEAVSRPSERHHENHRPSYRLFPAVEPTPPQSPQSLQKNRLKRASDYHKKRAISLDESARAVVARHNAPDRSTPVNRVKKGHLAGINSMSTLQESPVDSPTVPFAYGALYRTSEEDRSRSSSAPGEYIRDSQTLPTRGSVWTSKQADSHAGGAPMGLGLSMPVSRLAERPPTRQGPHKIRPPLTIEIKKLEDRPPPPPPKSPRHARTPSVQSGVSSMHGESPSSGAVATPGSLMRGTLVDAQGSPVQMPPILHAKQGSYSSNGSDLRVREIVLKKGQNGLTKPGTSSSAAPIVGNDRSQTGSKPSSQPLDRSVARSDLDSQWQLPQLPFTEREHGRTHSAGTSVSRPSGMPAPLFTERDHTRTLSAETTSNRPIGTPPRHPRQPSKDVPTGVAQSWTTAKLEGEPRILPSKRQESSPLAIQRTEQSRAADRSRVPSPEQQRGDETQAQTLDKKVYEASANAQKPHIQNQPQTQGPSSVPSQGIASAVQEKPLERNVETSATTKPVKPNLDKPMPSLPTTSGGIRDHYREVQEAEDSGVSKRPKLAPSAPSQESTKSSTTRGHDSGRASPAPAAKQTSVLPAAQSPSAGSTTTVRPVKETRVPTTTSDASRRSEEPAKAHGHKKADLEMRPPTSSLQPLKKTTKRDVRSPTPDAGSRPQSPPAIDRPPSAMDKALPTSFSEGNSHSRSATPDLARTSAKTPDPAAAEADPIATLQSLSKQVDALHARYTQLRTDRLRLSTAISSNLKDQKPGPGYANTLLDQHLSINAINSSMDIIFAKLRSLDCRKEDAIALLVAQTKSKSIAEDNVTEDTRSVASWQSSVTANLTTPSGRSTPDVEPKTLSPRFYNPSKLSPSIASTMSSAAPTPDLRNSPSTLQKLEKKDGQPTAETEKRVTVIRDSPEDDGEAMPVTATKALPPPPMSTKSIISSIEEEKNKIKRIRIKGAKAAKLLGLVAESRPGRPGSPEITLPDGSSLVKADRRDQLDIEVEISSKYSAARTKPASEGPVPAAMATVPKRKPVTSPRQGTNDSVSSVGTSSVNESAPDEPEVNTPRNSEDAPFGLKSAKRGMLQTIQVFVDDDILDYYKSTER